MLRNPAPDWARPAERANVHDLAIGAQFFGSIVRKLLSVRRGPQIMHDATEQIVQQGIAIVDVVGVHAVHGASQNEFASQARFRGGGRRQPRMIRLSCADSNDSVGVPAVGFAEQELKLAQLVAAHSQPRQIVSLDEDADL
jgi:hypothetical protein